MGPASDLQIEAEEMIRVRDRLYQIMATHTGQDMEKVEHDCDRNKWLNAEEAVDYGVADKILEKMPSEEKQEK